MVLYFSILTMQDDDFAADYCLESCPNFQFFEVLFRQDVPSSSNQTIDSSVGSSPLGNSGKRVDVIIIDDDWHRWLSCKINGSMNLMNVVNVFR